MGWAWEGEIGFPWQGELDGGNFVQDGVVWLLGPVGVHVIDSLGPGGSDGLIEGLDLVTIGRRQSCSSPRTP
jgi:hypothetical protein